MRFLGLLFLLVLIVAGVGYCRGWFTVSTTHAGERDNVTVGIDQDRVERDIHAAGERITSLSAQAVAKLQRLAHKVGPDTKQVEGTVASVDVSKRELAVTSGTERIDVHVPTTVQVTQNGAPVALDRVQVGQRVQLVLKETGDTLDLQRVELLP